MPDQLARLTAALADRYRVQRELGHGGMATVYLAQDQRHDRLVAIKVLHPALAADLGAERFLREIKVAARLNHPRILPLFDSGDAEGLLYYVMPYVEGESLRDRLATSGPLPVMQAAQIANAVALALDYAHRHQVVHRDIKPDNVMLLDGEAVVTDFGIAKPLVLQRDDTLTQTGMVVGTPAYMSPEQATGETDIDGRSDLYSLGCVLYEMLAGQRPFAGSSALALLAKQITERPASVRIGRQDVPEALDRAVLKALEKDPADRFATGAEFGEAVSPWTTPSATHAVSEIRPPAPAGASIAVLPFASISTDPENELFAEGIVEEIISALSSLEELRVASRTSTFTFKARDTDPIEAGRRLKVAHVLLGSVRKAGNQIRVTAELVNVAEGNRVWSERYDRDLADVFGIQDEIARAIVEVLKLRLLGLPSSALARRHPDDVETYTLYLKGRYFWNKRTPDSLRQSLQHFGQALDRDPTYVLAYVGQADVHNVLGWWSDIPPGTAFPRALEAAGRALELDPSFAEAHASLAFAKLFYQWDWVGAERLFRQSIAQRPAYPTARQWLAQLLAARGRHQEAAAEIHRALDLDPLSLIIGSTVSLVHYFAHQYDLAIDIALKTLDLDPGWGVGHGNMGLAYQQKGMYDQAIESFRKAISLSRFKTRQTAMLGHAQGQAGDTAAARTILTQLEREAGERYVSPLDLALVHTGLGEHDLAFRCIGLAQREHSSQLIFLGVEPMFDSLRPDPRFIALLQDLGLEAGAQATASATSEQSGSG